MAKRANQRPLLLEMLHILYTETDEEHGISRNELMEKLAAAGIEVNRKTVGENLEVLKDFGISIEKRQEGRTPVYCIVERTFELAELKLLVDLVQSSRYITEKKSDELIRKLEGLAGRHQARELQRQVQITGRVKSMNQSVYYNVDAINRAINENTGIRFQYYQWNNKKELLPKYDGRIYRVSPWKLIWDNENYYLLGFDEREQEIRNYRVDKMKSIGSSGEPRQGKEEIEALDLPTYTNTLFGMFGGTPVRVTLEGEGYLAGAVLDRFGSDIIMRPLENGGFSAVVNVVPSKLFLGWIMGLGGGVRITAPDSVVEQMRKEIIRLQGQYFPDQQL